MTRAGRARPGLHTLRADGARCRSYRCRLLKAWTPAHRQGAEVEVRAIITNGQGEMKGKIFRVAHLGFFDYLDTIALLGAMEHIAQDTLRCPARLRQGLIAAQKVYAERTK